MNKVPFKTAPRPGVFAALFCLGAACDTAPEETASENNSGNGSTVAIAAGLGTVADTNGDGQADVYDPHGNGSVVGPGVDTNADGQPDAIGHDIDGDGVIDALDTTGDGVPDRFAPSGVLAVEMEILESSLSPHRKGAAVLEAVLPSGTGHPRAATASTTMQTASWTTSMSVATGFATASTSEPLARLVRGAQEGTSSPNG